MGGFAFEQLDGFLDIHYQIAVESGSFQGDGTEALLNHFSTVYTIEIDQDLHEAVKSRFASDPRVIPLLGDSGQCLPRLLDFFSLRPKQKHCSGSMPIGRETNASTGASLCGKDTPVTRDGSYQKTIKTFIKDRPYPLPFSRSPWTGRYSKFTQNF